MHQVARELGLEGAGEGLPGKACDVTGIARVIDHGSRLSAMRLAQVHSGGGVSDMKRGFDENDLHENLERLD